MGLLQRLKQRMPSLVGRSLMSFLLRFVGLFFQFAGSILVARLLGVEGFGVYSYAFTWAAILGTLIGLGLGQLAVREVPRFLVRGDAGLLRGFLITAVALIFLTGVLAAGILALLDRADLLPLHIGWPLVTVAAVLQALILAFSSVLNGFQRVVWSQFLESNLRQVTFLVPLGAGALLGHVFTAQGVFTLAILATLPILALMLWSVLRSYRRAVDGQGAPAQYRPATWVLAALPFMAMSIANQMQTNLDVVMVGILGEPADVGRYRTASRAVDLAIIANLVAVQVLGPMLSRALAQKDTEAAQRLVSQTALLAGGFGLTICIVLGVGAYWYLALFGPEFQPAATALRLLLIGQAVNMLVGPVGVILLMTGREKTALAINLSGLAANFTLNLLLIPRYGIEGAALATLIAVGLTKTGLLIAVRRTSDLRPSVLAAVRDWLRAR